MGRSEYMQHIVLLQRKRLTCLRGRYDQNIENCAMVLQFGYIFMPTYPVTASFTFPFPDKLQGHLEEQIGIF